MGSRYIVLKQFIYLFIYLLIYSFIYLFNFVTAGVNLLFRVGEKGITSRRIGNMQNGSRLKGKLAKWEEVKWEILLRPSTPTFDYLLWQITHSF